MKEAEKLSPEESQALEECLVTIKRGPRTPGAIGPAIDRIDREGLYRSVSNVQTLLSFCGIEPEEATRILQEFRAAGLGNAAKQSEHLHQIAEQPILPPPVNVATVPSQLGGLPATEQSPNQSRTAIRDSNLTGSLGDGAQRKRRTPGVRAQSETAAYPSSALKTGGAGTSLGGVPANGPVEAIKGSSDAKLLPQELLLRRKALTQLVSEIDADPAIHSRVCLDQATVVHYTERMKAGDLFPPMDVFDVGGKLLLVDGFHRFAAAKAAGYALVEATVHRGTRWDAIKYGIEANLSHGLPYNNKDKRRAVEMVLQSRGEISDGAIAEICMVSQPFVSKIRHQLKTVMSRGKRTGRDGKKRKVPQRRPPATTGQGAAAEKTTDPRHGQAAKNADANPSGASRSDERRPETKCEGEKNESFQAAADRDEAHSSSAARPAICDEIKRAALHVAHHVREEAGKRKKHEQELFWETFFAAQKEEACAQARLGNLAMTHAMAAVFRRE